MPTPTRDGRRPCVKLVVYRAHPLHHRRDGFKIYVFDSVFMPEEDPAKLCSAKSALGIICFPVTDSSCGYCHKHAESGVTVHDGGADLYFYDLLVEALRHDALVQTFYTMHYCLDAALAMIPPPPSPDCMAEIFNGHEDFITVAHAGSYQLPGFGILSRRDDRLSVRQTLTAESLALRRLRPDHRSIKTDGRLATSLQDDQFVALYFVEVRLLIPKGITPVAQQSYK